MVYVNVDDFLGKCQTMSRNKAKQKVSFSFVPRLGTASFNSPEAAKSSNCTFYATRKQGANARLRSSELRFFSLSFRSVPSSFRFSPQVPLTGTTDRPRSTILYICWKRFSSRLVTPYSPIT